MKRYRTDNRLDITEYRITTDSIHLAAPLTVALIADLHDRPCKKIISFLADRKPDLIAIAGDFVDGYAIKEMAGDGNGSLIRIPKKILKHSNHIFTFLKKCAALAPAYCSLGNHEWMLSKHDLRLIAKTGVHLLDNTSEEFSPSFASNTQQRILIGGLTSSSVMYYREYIQHHPEMTGYYPLPEPRPWWQRKKNKPPHLDYDWLDHFSKEEAFKLLLCHHPEYWMHKEPILSEMNIDLTMSGHAHGGQIRVFRRGIFAPGQGLVPKYTDGVHQGSHGHLVVSRGLANTVWIPRFGNCPELVFIRLYPRLS